MPFHRGAVQVLEFRADDNFTYRRCRLTSLPQPHYEGMHTRLDDRSRRHGF